MIYKNIELYNVAEVVPSKNGVTWLRVPSDVYESVEAVDGPKRCRNSTGVELRFLLNSETATFRLRAISPEGAKFFNSFHIYYGSIQGGWADHELDKYVSGDICSFTVKRPENYELLKKVSKDAGFPFDPEVIRIIFDRGTYEFIDIEGDVCPPPKEMLPKKTIMCYGSSITHGSNSIDMSHSWASVLAHNLNYDCRNLGMAGSCAMEEKMVDYIATEGEKGLWDVATLELGVNVLYWEDEKIVTRVTNTIRQIAGRNKNKPIFVISPFYTGKEYKGETVVAKWRNIIEDIVKKESFENVTYINGLDLLGQMHLLSADEVHPNIYGVAQIADKLTKRIKEVI